MSEAICLVIDTGVTASQKVAGNRSFLEASLECASLIVEKKLFSESKDEVAVVLFGSEETNNPMAHTGEYDHITVVERGLATADFELVSFLREHVTGTELEPDWLSAVVIAMTVLKQASDEKKYSALKIVLFSELGCDTADTDPESLEDIVRGLRSMDVDFNHIGPDWVNSNNSEADHDNGSNGNSQNGHDDDGPSTSRGEPSKRGSRKKTYEQSKPMTRIQQKNLTSAQNLVNITQGCTISINDAVVQFLYKSKRGKKPFPWKVCFTIGNDIRINTTGYVFKRRENPKPWKRCLAKGGDEELKAETKYFRETETRVDGSTGVEEVEPENVVLGYKYGQEKVIVTEHDEQMAKFDGGPKSMTLFGFLARSQVHIHQLVGDGCMIFMPSEGDANSQRAWAALTRAMLDLDMVAVVRRVYNRNSAPRLGALVPEHNSEGEVFLAYVELPFAEDIKPLDFPVLPKPKETEVAAFDDLIDVMMLTETQTDETGEVIDSVDHLNTENMENPSIQYLFQCLRHRALHPGRVLPPPDDHIMEILRINSDIEAAAVPVLEDIRNMFPTKVNEKEVSKRKRSEKDDSDDSKKAKLDDGHDEVTEVGTTTPVEDFRYLLSHSVTSNTTLDSLAQQLEMVVIKLLSSPLSASLATKILACLAAHREESCHRRRPELYNAFIRRVRERLGGSSKLWLEVAEANLGLIADSEVAGGAAEREAVDFLMPPEEKNDNPGDKDDFGDNDSDELLASL